ncbi:glycosyltransferase [Porifericola rhodea]|uniref:glycosyltransferase n=1 Tax=Porifericola rhodea TaxID=930972 RepID=UPI002665793D|nr:glycosyltransferase [Porifericola rhodea]WKN32590.1 glycosyltransferase [Porifericola rhodea]
MLYLGLAISLLTFIYALFILYLWHFWRKVEPFKLETSEKNSSRLSIVIPVRNEASNIINLLQDLDRQRWPDGSSFAQGQVEVIVVDDHSEDSTKELVQNFDNQCIKLRVLSLNLPDDFKGSHKKAAISKAIAIAQGKYIITTDGDCRVDKNWLAAYLQFFARQQAVMISAPVTFSPTHSLFEKMQQIEFASLIGTGGACLSAGYPNMCNGANLAFSKEAFIAVDGYLGNMHIPSGDDEFLIQKLSRHYPGQIHFMKSSAALICTTAQQSLRNFYYQRKRWASKWKLHKSMTTAFLALFVFSFHALLIVTVLCSIAGFFAWQWALCLLGLKAGLELLFLRAVLKDMKQVISFRIFLLLQLIYSPYAVFFGIVANFGGYQWKKRRYA